MMQTLNLLDGYLKLSKNCAITFQEVSLLNRKERACSISGVFQALGIQLPGLLGSFSTAWEFCCHLHVQFGNAKMKILKMKGSRTTYLNEI